MSEYHQSEMTWKDAIREVLRDVGEPMHYKDIAEEIAGRGLRRKFGATPAATVVAQMSGDIQQNGRHSQFVRVDSGTYTLRELLDKEKAPTPTPTPTREPEEEPAGVINAFGMFWRRSAVNWTSSPKIWGQQQRGADRVDFGPQKGVYLLHDAHRTIYVGRAAEQRLGRRLYQHTADRLEGRWDRWSWFGVLAVTDQGELREPMNPPAGSEAIITAMEALLIESLEPAQNRRRGDEFRAVEYLQAEDPDVKRRKIERVMERFEEEFLT